MTTHKCNQEVRLSKLESDTAVNKNSIDSLVKAFDNLTNEVMKFRFTVMAGMITFIGYLLKLKLGW